MKKKREQKGRREGVKVIRIYLDSKGKEAEVASKQEINYLVFFLPSYTQC